MLRLIKFTSGEAKELIKGCVHREGNCYDYAKSLLVSHFGEPYKIINSYRKELSSIRQIKYGDSSALSGNYQSSFDNSENLSIIVNSQSA